MKEFLIAEPERKKLVRSIKKAKIVPAPENSLGQWIGYFLDSGTEVLLEEICSNIKFGDKLIEIAPKPGEGLIKLKNTLGQLKQIDHVIKVDKADSLIVEVKWLKDQRHLNDKGAWVLMMTDILIENKNLRGIITVLAGPWEGMRSIIEKRAKVIIIPVEKVYEVLSNNNIDIIIDQKRNAYKNPRKTLNGLLNQVNSRQIEGFNLLKEIGYQIVSEYKQELRSKILDALTNPVKIDI